MTHLTVTEYDQSTEFPVTISVDNTEEYTFAVFGKNGVDGIEPEPVVTMKGQIHVAYVNVSPTYGMYVPIEVSVATKY